MGSMVSIIGLITLGCGLYCLYGAYLMRTKGEIKQALVLSQDINIKTCKDVKGYCREAQVPLFILGAVVTIYSVVDLYNTSVGGIDTLYWVMFVLAAVALIYYIIKIRACNKKYFGV